MEAPLAGASPSEDEESLALLAALAVFFAGAAFEPLAIGLTDFSSSEDDSEEELDEELEELSAFALLNIDWQMSNVQLDQKID